MKRREDIYNVGNDYFQKTSAYFLDTDEKVTEKGLYGKAYSDGLYHYTIAPVYELSGGESALNKRIFNKLPQSGWAAPDFITDENASAFSAAPAHSAVYSPDYATIEDPTDNEWKKPE
jgi:hypothetical protein